jgi:hypothetical protein
VSFLNHDSFDLGLRNPSLWAIRKENLKKWSLAVIAGMKIKSGELSSEYRSKVFDALHRIASLAF